jgi:hypothetical protein
MLFEAFSLIVVTQGVILHCFASRFDLDQYHKAAAVRDYVVDIMDKDVGRSFRGTPGSCVRA